VRTEGTTVLFLIVTAIAALAAMTRPRLVLWLLPVAIAIPRTVPRLMGTLGPLELALALGAAVLLMHLAIHRERVHTDPPLTLMLLATLPIGLSWLAGRGEGDSGRLYIWVGSCVAYLLALNLADDRRAPYRLLGTSAVIVVGFLIADVLLKGLDRPAAALWQRSAAWKTYRQQATTVGMGSFAMTMMTIVLPVPLAYGVLAQRRSARWAYLITFLAGSALALSFLTRAVVVNLAVSVLAMAYVLSVKRGASAGKVVLSIAAVSILSLAIVQAQIPGIIDVYATRFAIPLSQDPRVSIWRGLLEKASASPLWGYGAVSSMERFGIHGGHGLFPQVLFEYGLSFALPLGVVLALWVRNSWRLVQRTDPESRQFAFAVASWGVVAGILSNAVANVYLYGHGAYSTLAFFSAGLLAAQLRVLDAKA
jgi:hypothetical protein